MHIFTRRKSHKDNILYSPFWHKSMRKMLSSFWLLTDLDGTIIPTPHKAHGKYVSLSDSPCFPTIEKWLRNGGNLCVVTTADRRAIDQVYLPARKFLKKRDEDISSGGEMLLSLYTGAVLYRCSQDGIDEVDGYCDPKHPMKSKETCFSSATCETLTDLVADIFCNFAADAIYKRSPLIEGWENLLSRRYQNMWQSIFKFLRGRLADRKKYLDQKRKGLVSGDHRQRDSAWSFLDHLINSGQDNEWMVQFLRSRKKLLTDAGIIRREHLKSKKEIDDYVKSRLDNLGEKLNLSYVSVEDPENTQGVCVTSVSNGVEDLATEMSPLPSANEGKHAQLIVVGIPMRMYHHYFKDYPETFAKLGVYCSPQPNSVVFSLMGTNKGTLVNYLDSSSVLHGESVDGFRGKVHLGTSIGLGDNPQTVDRELALYPHLPFVSLERFSQRDDRHKLIDSGLASEEDKKELLDDRKLEYIRYVGGEEEGCNDFLTRFMIGVDPRLDPRNSETSFDAWNGPSCTPLVLSVDRFKEIAFSAADDARNNQFLKLALTTSKL